MIPYLIWITKILSLEMLGRGSNRLGFYFYSNLKLQIDSFRKAAFLTLTNANKRNPLSLQTLRQLHSCLTEVQSKIQSQNLKILILTGEGSVFSAGHDLIELRNTQEPEKIFQQCMKTMLLLKYFPLITLCAVNNMATAAGFQLALTCDIILATKQASFGIPGMKRGLFPSTPLVQLERSLKSQCLSKEIVIFGQMISSEEALTYGLINKVVQAQKMQQQINGYISKANQLSGQVIALGKAVLNSQQQLGLQEGYSLATKGMMENLAKEDCQEGLAAFAEKRQPNFTK